jgi:hypothetical protein
VGGCSEVPAGVGLAALTLADAAMPAEVAGVTVTVAADTTDEAEDPPHAVTSAATQLRVAPQSAALTARECDLIRHAPSAPDGFML